MTTPPPTEPYPLPVLTDAGLTKPSGDQATERAIAQRSAIEMSVRVNFMECIRAGANLHQASAIAGCSVRTIYGWLAAEPRFRQGYHDARWEAEKNSLEQVRQLAPESVRAAIYLAERQREQSQHRSTPNVDQPPEELLARIEAALRATFDGFALSVESIEDESVRDRLFESLRRQVQPLEMLFKELWQRYNAT